jgi:phosphoglucosamine mutase
MITSARRRISEPEISKSESMIKPGQRSLFGTDGIRGMAGHFPLDKRTTRLMGRALGHHLSKKKSGSRVVIGEDTRESSGWIAASVAAGLREAGFGVESAGVITTPGVAFLARTRKFEAGVVISASHNPWTDNGIKIFGHDGYKLPDEVELDIEREIFELLESGSKEEMQAAPALTPVEGLHQLYAAWLSGHVDSDELRRTKVVVDCANGAASAIAPEVFADCGVATRFIHNQPNGKNINENCGALHPEVVAREMAGSGADVGITFDGDADRSLFADAQGNVVNGDAALLLVAREWKSRGMLKGDVVVGTTMSNMGVEKALAERGIRMLRAPVGDKYVLEEMRKSGATLGGEQSGHIIFRDGEATTGDGLLTALRVLEIVARRGKTLAELLADLKVFPQTIRNVRVREKKPLEQIPEIAREIRAAEAALDGSGRVIVRYSGTEPVARVMIEAESEEQMNKSAERIVVAIQRALGV